MVYDFGLRLKELRNRKNLYQNRVAQQIGVTRATISSYERNIKTPSLEVLKKLAILYNASIDYILGFDARSNIYLDDLNESQQKAMMDVLLMIKRAFAQQNIDDESSNTGTLRGSKHG